MYYTIHGSDVACALYVQYDQRPLSVHPNPYTSYVLIARLHCVIYDVHGGLLYAGKHKSVPQTGIWSFILMCQ